MKKRKSIVFWVINFELLILYVVTLFKSPEMLASVGVVIIIMLIGNGATFIGGVVANAWQKSKYYKIELDELHPESPRFVGTE